MIDINKLINLITAFEDLIRWGYNPSILTSELNLLQ